MTDYSHMTLAELKALPACVERDSYIQSCLQIIRRLDDNAAAGRRLLGLPTHEDSNDLLKRCLPTIKDDAHEMTKTSFNPEDQASADAMWQLAYDIEKAIYPHLP